jgi:hypothetical protein
MRTGLKNQPVSPGRAPDSTRPRQHGSNQANTAVLSDAAVADLAREMWIPEGLFRAVVERYPQLNRVLARRYRATTCTA